MRANIFTSWLVAALLVALAVPAAAQTGDDDTAKVGVTFGFLRFGEFASSKAGVDGSYTTKQLTKPAGSLGIRAGVVGEVGVHHFDGANLTSFQGGVHLTSDKVRRPKFLPYANIMFGFGHFDLGTDTLMSLIAGANLPLEGKPYSIKVEVGQVWDIYDGGHDVGWRYTVGVSLPVGNK